MMRCYYRDDCAESAYDAGSEFESAMKLAELLRENGWAVYDKIRDALIIDIDSRNQYNSFFWSDYNRAKRKLKVMGLPLRPKKTRKD